MTRTEKMFRAIVILGAALTAEACGDDKCSACVPVDAQTDAVATTDAPKTDGNMPPVDAILIL